MMFLMHCCIYIYISYYIILYHIWYSYLYMFSGRNFGLGSKSQKDRIILRDQKTSLDVLIARCFLVCIYIYNIWVKYNDLTTTEPWNHG